MSGLVERRTSRPAVKRLSLGQHLDLIAGLRVSAWTMRSTLTSLGEYTSPQSRGETWHLHRLILPRRSITGRLLFGVEWRRPDRAKSIYKKLERFRPVAIVNVALTLFGFAPVQLNREPKSIARYTRGSLLAELLNHARHCAIDARYSVDDSLPPRCL
jgi:hypothetical protein